MISFVFSSWIINTQERNLMFLCPVSVLPELTQNWPFLFLEIFIGKSSVKSLELINRKLLYSLILTRNPSQAPSSSFPCSSTMAGTTPKNGKDWQKEEDSFLSLYVYMHKVMSLLWQYVTMGAIENACSIIELGAYERKGTLQNE